MAEIITEHSILIEILSVHKILEGLIHNINTPLNVIIGYSQQLKKKHPEIEGLEKIYDAGLHIDDLIRSCSESFINRMDTSYSEFDLNKWLTDELMLLKNIMEVKHSYRFELKSLKGKVHVKSNTSVLGLFFDSIILFLKNKTELIGENKVVSIKMERHDNTISLEIRLPDYRSFKTGIKEYLTELRNELECIFEQIFAEGNPFSWEVSTDKQIKIYIPIES